MVMISLLFYLFRIVRSRAELERRQRDTRGTTQKTGGILDVLAEMAK
jgi:hypothetical protein